VKNIAAFGNGHHLPWMVAFGGKVDKTVVMPWVTEIMPTT